MKKRLIEDCPNCEEPDENIKPTKDGKCGVCGGTGKIEWKEVGKLVLQGTHKENTQ